MVILNLKTPFLVGGNIEAYTKYALSKGGGRMILEESKKRLERLFINKMVNKKIHDMEVTNGIRIKVEGLSVEITPSDGNLKVKCFHSESLTV